MQHLMQDLDFFTHAYMLNCMSLALLIKSNFLTYACIYCQACFLTIHECQWSHTFRLWRRMHEFSLCRCCSLPLSLTIHEEHLMLVMSIHWHSNSSHFNRMNSSHLANEQHKINLSQLREHPTIKQTNSTQILTVEITIY